MKKQILVGAIAFAAILVGTNNAQAQAVQAKHSVSLNIFDVISIDPSSAANGHDIFFDYSNTYHYTHDQTINVPASLKVFSTKNFDVSVRADGENFVGPSGSEIPVSVLTIKPNMDGTTTMNGAPADVILSTTDQGLLFGSSLGRDLILDIDYFIPESEASSDRILGKASGFYTQKVTFTVTQN